MAITFNNVWTNVKGCAYYDASAATDILKHTIRGSQGNVYNVDVFPDSGVAVGDAFIFAFDYNKYGKANQLKVNLNIGIGGTGITGVWEYAVGGTVNAPNWLPLSVISDGTVGLTATGSQILSFNVPADWDSFHWTGISPNIYYCFGIRYRITGFTTWTEGGHIANVSNSTQGAPYAIYTSGYTSSAPCTLSDIYNASVAGGWGVVSKNNNVYVFDCSLVNYNYNYISSKDEVIQFNNNWFLSAEGSYSIFLVGELVSGSNVRKGSSFIFLGSNCNYPTGSAFGTDSILYNMQFKHIVLSASVGFNGYWGAGFGAASGQKIYNLYVQGMRQLALYSTSVAVIGVTAGGLSTGDCHIEGFGAIIKNVTIYGGSFCIRPTTANYMWVHDCDFSGATSSPLNPYWSTNINPWRFYTIDCNYGTFADANKAKWTNSGAPIVGDQKVMIQNSVLLKVVDKNGNAIAGATVKMTDKDGNVVFTYTTNTDGYVARESGTISSATASSLTDSSKSWTTNQFGYQEVVITSGSGVGQRRIIFGSNGTATSFNFAPDTTTALVAGDRYIIIPYITTKHLSPASYAAYTLVNSIGYDYNPFTLEISKAGYETYTAKMTITNKIDMTIKLAPNPSINLSTGGLTKKLKDGVCLNL